MQQNFRNIIYTVKKERIVGWAGYFVNTSNEQQHKNVEIEKRAPQDTAVFSALTFKM